MFVYIKGFLAASMSEINVTNEAIVAVQNALEDSNLQNPGFCFSISNSLFLAISKMPKDVPDDILRTVLGFLSFEDNMKNLFVNKKFSRVIEKSGNQLPRQEVSMYIHNQRNMVDFWNSKKTIRITDGPYSPPDQLSHQKVLYIEGKVGVEFTGLKNIIVTQVQIRDGMAQFEAVFQRIKDRLLGGQVMSIKTVDLRLIGDTMLELARFQRNYSSLYSWEIPD